MAPVCPSCGIETPAGARFCASCGSALHSEHAEATSSEERKVVSVLFADLVGFTERTEQSDPEDVRTRLTVYHRSIRQNVEAFGGRIEKLMGDGVFAVFGAPTAHEDDPERAIRSALRIQDAVERLNEDDPELALSVRVAVTTGEAIVQLDGDDPDREGIIGDVVNTASRLEAVAPAGGIVADERTYLSTRSMIVYDDLDAVDLKGKTGTTAIWLARTARSRIGVALEDPHRGPFVGRDAELAILIDAFERTVQGGTAQLVTVISEPGVGKSRLLHEFRTVFDTRSDLVWWRQGRCLPYGEGITYWALGEIVKAQAGILESDSEADAERKLRHAVNSLIDDTPRAEWIRARLVPLAGGPADGESIEQSELFSAWLGFFEALARRHPLIMVVEDIHWADDALLDFLEHVADWAVGIPILLIVAARPELFSNRAGWGGGKRNATTISLAPLGHDDSAVLLAALLNRVVLPAETQQLILDHAGGNPLYVTEFVRLADDQDLLENPQAIHDLALPDSIQAIIAARLDLLEPEEKAVLQAAAVVGKVFWAGALSALRPATQVSPVLRELIKRELIRPVRDPSMHGRDEYAFMHALVRDVAYGQIARSERASLHQAVAGWIEAVSGERGADVAELLAYHLGEAMDLVADPDADLRARVYQALMQAGERARELVPSRGAEYYRRAIAAAADDRDRGEALLWYGRTAVLDTDTGYAALNQALGLFRSEGDTEGEATALVDIAGLEWWRGDTETAMERGLAAIRLLENRPDTEAKAHALVARATGLYLRGDYFEALDAAERAAPVVNAVGSSRDQVRLLLTRGGSLGAEGIDDLEMAIRIADDRSLTWQSIVARNNLATMMQYFRPLIEAVALIDEAIDLSEERGLPANAEWARFTKAEILLPAGRWDEVLSLTGEVIRADDERGGTQAGIGARTIKGWVRYYRSHEDETRTMWDDIIERSREIRDQQVLVPVLAFAVTLAHDAGHGNKALALADEYNDIATGAFRVAFMPWVTEPLAALGDEERLASLLDEGPIGLGLPGGLGIFGEIGLARARGHAAAVHGDRADAIERFLAAAAMADASNHMLSATLARIDAARVLAESEDRDAMIRDARRDAESMGATKLLGDLDEIEGIAHEAAAEA